ncbi:GGDEF domain-containing protein [Candidatus Falkowbacteria bacterium]|nr:GGDEF domain-containing protein [Candidatus Falkowbacteria bacterium]
MTDFEKTPQTPRESHRSVDRGWLDDMAFLMDGATPEGQRITPEIPKDIFELLSANEPLREYFRGAVIHALKSIAFEFYSREQTIQQAADAFGADLPEDQKTREEKIFELAQNQTNTPAGQALFDERINNFRATVTRLINNVREMAKSQIDPMTGLYSKDRVEEELTREVAAYNRKPEQQEMIVLFIDGDRFKHYNDSYGHELGDEIIKQIGAAIKHSIREQDFAGRKGGDEFFVVLSNITLKDITSYQEIVGRIQEAISAIDLTAALKAAYSYDLETDAEKKKKIDDLIKKMGQEGPVSATIGVTASAGRGGLSAKQLFAEADAALYAAKNQRGSIVLAPEINKRANS